MKRSLGEVGLMLRFGIRLRWVGALGRGVVVLGKIRVLRSGFSEGLRFLI